MTQNKHLWCVIMAGGIGSRFWPLSKNNYPKQFIDILGTGKSFILPLKVTADGTRYSKEFATFLKEFLGYIPDYGQIAPETISRKG